MRLLDALKKRDSVQVNAALNEALDSYLHGDECAGLPYEEKFIGFKSAEHMREFLKVSKPLEDWSQRFCIDVMYTYIKSKGLKTGCYEGVTEGFGCCMRNMSITRFLFIMFKDDYFAIIDELEEIQQE